MFSDSVQDAAQRAAVAEIRNTAAVIRKSLYQAIIASESGGLSLGEVIAEVPEASHRALGSEAFAAAFTARDQTWREPYERLLSGGSLGSDDRFLGHVKLRLGWEYFSDLTYRSHTSQTLEAAGLAVAEVSPALVQKVAETFLQRLRNAVSGPIKMDEAAAARFLAGILQQMRRRGAVGHAYVAAGMGAARPGIGGPNYFAAARSMGLGHTAALPTPNHRRAAAPVPVTLLRSADGYQSLLRDHSTNWYRDWADKFFLRTSLGLVDQYPAVFETALRCLEAEGMVRAIRRPDGGDEGFVIEPDVVTVSDRVRPVSCTVCKRKELVLADNAAAIGAPCTQIGCHGALEEAAPSAASFAASLLATDRNHRIVAREHTGILEAEVRRAIEHGFIKDNEPWSPNLISATPTLEMGIDIGDLSTLLLCSVPPEEANYIQRMGRSGRRDGNALNLTIALARPHDLQFWEQPDSMLAGQVRVPGVYIGALSVLLRQVAAFSLDRFVADGGQVGDYGKVRTVLRHLREEWADGFPLNWFRYLFEKGAVLAGDYLALLPPEVSGRPDIVERLTAFLTERDELSLVGRVRGLFDEAAADRADLISKRRELDNEARRVRYRDNEMTPEKLQERLDGIKRDKAEINHAIRQGIDDMSVLRFLTDKGILPNYAFPEEGIKLKSILARHTEDGRREARGENLVTREYVRPASSALSEFAPGQMFYANGRVIEIDRIDLNRQDLSRWRFCQNCSHVDAVVAAEATSDCPRCGDEMWSDVGSLHDSVELKGVVNFTSEQKAAIREADDRQQKQYDRAMVPFYGPGEIESSWYAQSTGGSTPFGFEFIAPCTFRDFNFGRKKEAPVGPRIAGQPRKSLPFVICRHCGSVQPPPRGDDDPGKHLPRCPVQQRDGDMARDDWESKVFLMRRFATESIRIVVPVAGEASDDDIKSFVAAINLGMRKHFAGKVDHIRSTVVDAQLDGLVTVRSLFLYDAVPGGSGYLRQLAEHPDSLRAVIERAAEALRSCTCVDEGRSGCFRCVKSYRSLFGPGEPDRDTALHMMEAVLATWDSLARTDTGIDTRIRDFLVESKLEHRFLETLETRFGEGCIKPQVLEGGRRGFLLKVNEGSTSHFWTIETQVQIDKRFNGAPRKRVDFLISPVGGLKAKPIVVEMDGLKYHAQTVAEDLETRLLLIRSGFARVWTLGWHDLEPERALGVPSPMRPELLHPSHPGILAKVRSLPALHGVASSLTREIEMLQGGHSLEGLFHYLSAPGCDLQGAAAVLSLSIIGRNEDLSLLPRVGAVTEDGRSFLREAEFFGHVNERGLDVYLGGPRRSPGEWPLAGRDCRILLRGTLPRVEGDPSETPGYSDAWRGLWRLVNLLQDVPGFHVEFEGLDTLSAPDLSSAGKGPHEQAWLEVQTLVGEAFHRLVDALQAADVPAPDLIGADVTREGEVIGMIEMGWSVQRLAICEEDFDSSDWSLIRFEPESEQSLMEIVRTVLSKLGEHVE